LANLIRTGFSGDIYPVNPKYPELGGLPCYPDIDAIPAPPDVAYILLPARASVAAARQCAERGVGLVIVCSSGFSEVDGGSELQAELALISATSQTRILGPNCIGVVTPGAFVGAPTYNLSYSELSGDIAILTHSGGMGVTVLNRLHAAGVGVRTMVSLGNEADLDATTVLESLLDDEHVRVAILVLEQLRDVARFNVVARRAHEQGVAILAIKNGRSNVGARAVAGHTGAMAGDAALFSAVLRDAGVREATSIDELVDTAHLLSRLRGNVGPRLGVVTPSGGEGIYVADQAARLAIDLPSLDPELTRLLRELMPLGNPSNPLDLTGKIIGDQQLLGRVLTEMALLLEADQLLVALATWGEWDAAAVLPSVVETARQIKVPVVFSAWDAGTMTDRVVEILSTSGLAWFPSPDRALAAIDLAARRPTPTPRGDDPIAVPAPRSAGPGTSLGASESLTLLGGVGLPVVEEVVVSTSHAAMDAASRLEGPVVLKLHAPDVAHKTELGLVELGLRTDDEVAAASERLLELGKRHQLAGEGLVVAPMLTGGVEVIVGALRDSSLGPFVLVGAGGTLAEHFADTVLITAPAQRSVVLARLGSLRCWPVLSGARGAMHDIESLVDLVVLISRIIAGTDWIGEIDLNPVLVRARESGGAVALDALVTRHQT
jgi:acyl-CoA synthetase (NDP forming)